MSNEMDEMEDEEKILDIGRDSDKFGNGNSESNEIGKVKTGIVKTMKLRKNMEMVKRLRLIGDTLLRLVYSRSQ